MTARRTIDVVCVDPCVAREGEPGFVWLRDWNSCDRIGSYIYYRYIDSGRAPGPEHPSGAPHELPDTDEHHRLLVLSRQGRTAFNASQAASKTSPGA